MNYINHVIELLSKHLKIKIRIEDTGYESYLFEVDELDAELIPATYESILFKYTNVMTHIFVYEDYCAFILQPCDTKYDDYT